MNNTNSDSIPLRPLFNDLWVFALYGVVVSTLLWIATLLGLETGPIQKIMMEPMSFYVCGSLLVSSMLLLVFSYVVLRGDVSRMKSSRWVKYFLLPILNVGFSAGAIIAGMGFGVSFGTFLYSLFETEAFFMGRLLFAIALVFLALLYHLFVLASAGDVR